MRLFLFRITCIFLSSGVILARYQEKSGINLGNIPYQPISV